MIQSTLRAYFATLVGAVAVGGLVGAALHHLNLLRLAHERAAQKSAPAPQVEMLTPEQFEQRFGFNPLKDGPQPDKGTSQWADEERGFYL